MRRSYTIVGLAECCGVHRNTVRNWLANGLESIDNSRPTLINGMVAKAYLTAQRVKRKRPCPPGTLYCVRCRIPRKAALGMVDYVPKTEQSGNLRALCDTCGTITHRSACQGDLPRIMPDYSVQIVGGSDA